MSQVSIHLCAACHEPANYICSRCNVEFYCSRTCQSESFIQHRSVCFSLPSLKLIPLASTLNGSLSMINLADPKSASPEKVITAAAVEPKVVKAIEKSEQEISKTEKAIPTVDLVVNCEQEQEIQKTEKAIPIVDVAEKEEEPAVLKVPKPAFNSGPRTQPPNSFNNNKPSPSVTSTSKRPIENQTQIRQDFAAAENKGGFTVETLRRNQQTIFTNQPPPKVFPPKDNRIFKKDVKLRPLKTGQQKISIVNGSMDSKLFYIQENFPGVEEFLMHIEATVNDFVEKDKSKGYKPQKDEMILAIFEGQYFRASCEDIVDGKYKVFFVDYGNDAIVSEEDIKPLPQKLKNEMILNKVFIENMPSEKTITKKQVEILNDESGLLIDVLEKNEENVYLVKVCGF